AGSPARMAPRPAEVGIQRRAVVPRVAAPGAEFFPQEGVTPRGVEHEPGAPGVATAVVVAGLDGGTPMVRVEGDVGGTAALDHFGALARRIADQNLVEPGSAHLVRL